MKSSLLESIKDEYLDRKSNILKLKEYRKQLTCTNDSDILNDILEEKLIHNDETNNIVVCLGTYIKRGSREIQVPYNSCLGYNIYADIEKDVDSFKRIPVIFAKLYEKMNDVIYLKTSYPVAAFKRARCEFVENAIEHSQDDAKKMILEKYGR